MNSPLHFHILTASYNRPSLIERCYKSIQVQDSSWQWWVGDDASPNISRAFWGQFKRDPRVNVLLSKDNVGCNKIRNRLLDAILQSGKPGFILILDDDDYLADDALYKLSEAIQQHEDTLWFIAYCVYPNGEKLGYIQHQKNRFNYLQDYMIHRFIKGDFTHCIHTDAIKSNRFTEQFRNSEEWYFFSGIAQHSDMTLLDINTKVIEYLPEGLTQTGFNRDKKLQVQSLKVERLSEFLISKELSPYQLKLAKLQIQQRQFKEAEITLSETMAFGLLQTLKRTWLMLRIHLKK